MDDENKLDSENILLNSNKSLNSSIKEKPPIEDCTLKEAHIFSSEPDDKSNDIHMHYQNLLNDELDCDLSPEKDNPSSLINDSKKSENHASNSSTESSFNSSNKVGECTDGSFVNVKSSQQNNSHNLNANNNLNQTLDDSMENEIDDLLNNPQHSNDDMEVSINESHSTNMQSKNDTNSNHMDINEGVLEDSSDKILKDAGKESDIIKVTSEQNSKAIIKDASRNSEEDSNTTSKDTGVQCSKNSIKDINDQDLKTNSKDMSKDSTDCAYKNAIEGTSISKDVSHQEYKTTVTGNGAFKDISDPVLKTTTENTGASNDIVDKHSKTNLEDVIDQDSKNTDEHMDVVQNNEQDGESDKDSLSKNGKDNNEKSCENNKGIQGNKEDKAFDKLDFSKNIKTQAKGSDVKIKLRSFASLCEDDSPKNSPEVNDSQSDVNLEVSGITVGDIVQHNHFVESDESGVMHLKISNVVGGEDCITGILNDEDSDHSLNIHGQSFSSLVDSFNSEDSLVDKKNISISGIDEKNTDVEESFEKEVLEGEPKSEAVINIYKSTLVVAHVCVQCKMKTICEYRLVIRKSNENNVKFLCSEKCKTFYASSIPAGHVLSKPRLHFARICAMCGKEVKNVDKDSISFNWQTREFCDKLCLADHIGEVARMCFYCKSNVRVVYMVKYCVRFGPDVHQFCCNSCLEWYKSTIKVCSFCQKNLESVQKVISPSNKEYCSSKCLKRAQRRDVGQQNYKEQMPCHVCQKHEVNKYEFLDGKSSMFLCSLSCMNVFKYVNKVKSVNCCLCSRFMNADEATNYFFIGKQLRVFCSDSCFSVFVISARKIVTCTYCKVKKYSSDMIWVNSGGVSDYFCCSYCCLNLVEGLTKFAPVEGSRRTKLNFNITKVERGADASPPPNGDAEDDSTEPDLMDSSTTTTTSTAAGKKVSSSSRVTTPIIKNCSFCNKMEATQFHMVMSDSTLKSFCSYNCATKYKINFGFQVSTRHLEVKSKSKGTTSNKGAKEDQSMQSTLAALEKSTSTKDSSDKSKMDVKSFLNSLIPPEVCNKWTSCRPNTSEASTQIGADFKEESSQTDGRFNSIVPVPLPTYVPTPMAMFAAPTPVPLVVPIPVPVPVFVPTSQKTTEDIQLLMKSLFQEFSKRQEEFSRKRKRSGDDLEAEEDLSEGDSDYPPEVNVIINIQKNLKKFHIGSEAEDSEADSRPSYKRVKNDKIDDLRLDYQLGLAVWHAWTSRLKRDYESLSGAPQGLNEDLSKLSAKKLSHLLIILLDDLSGYTSHLGTDVIFYVLLGLQKYLFENGSTHCIFFEVNFDVFTTALDAMIRRYFQLATHPETNRLNATRVSESMLWDAKQLGAHTPYVLINTLFYFNTKYFKLKTALDHFNLTTVQLTKVTKKSDTGGVKSCLVYNKTKSKDAASSPAQVEENRTNPLHCAVKLYEFYLSKCPPQLRKDKEMFYVYPERTCLPDSSQWYSTDALEIRTLDKMLNRILLVKEIQENLSE